MKASRRRFALALLAAAASCTSSSSQKAQPPPPTPGQLQLDAATYAVAEGAGALRVTVTRTGGSDGVVTARLATADGTAASPGEYQGLVTTVTFQAGDTAPKTFAITIVDDHVVEPTRTFTVALSAPTGGAALGAPSSATVSILDDDAPVVGSGLLNDTGVVGCSDATRNGLACGSPADGTDQFPRQDGDNGRDVAARDDRDGRAGFSFTKLDAAGVALADQAVAYAVSPWPCVLDRVTGLTWEVRPADGGLRDRGWTYSFYSSAGAVEGTQDAGHCVDTSTCDTEKYAQAVNAAGLCGASDWRLPSRSEILGIVDLGAAAAPLVDAGYFPEATTGRVWSGSLDASGRPWALDLSTGKPVLGSSRTAYAVRLVRGGMQE